MLILQNLMYAHPNGDVLFEEINLTLRAQEKAALVGHNGAGKSTLLKLAMGLLPPTAGTVRTDALAYYVPQHVGQYNGFTVAQALGIADKLQALNEILDGRATEANLLLLNDDWTLEERCLEALAHWQLKDVGLRQPLHSLSGGQKTKVFLAGVQLHRPRLVLLDEPSNHLDAPGRELLYDHVRHTAAALLLVSHDRTLLNLVHHTYELGPHGITAYGGNHDFYAEQKRAETRALDQDVKHKEKALRKARETERESVERQQKLDARGKKKQEKAGLPTISMNTFRNNAEKSTSRIKNVHAEKVEALAREMGQARRELAATEPLKIDVGQPALHAGKILFTATDLNMAINGQDLWPRPLNFGISSGERIALTGTNGSGKTTLLKLLLGQAHPTAGQLYRAPARAVYIDQEYSLLDNRLTVYEQVQAFNHGNLPEHELKVRLNRFLFPQAHWDKFCGALSGGEKMRLAFCCLMVAQQAPDLMLLDEPTNNLDLQNLAILTKAIRGYRGTLIVVSHDMPFLREVETEREIALP